MIDWLSFAIGFASGVIAIIWLILYELTLYFGPRSPRENDMLEAKVIAVIIAAAVVFGGALAYREHVWTLGYNQRATEQKAAELSAIKTRLAQNVATAAKHESINATVTKVKDEKLAPVIRTIYVDRVRVGPSICGSTTPTKADDAPSGDEADTGTRLVSPQAEERIRELDAEVEEHLATGRACQDWGIKHGFVP